MAAIGLLVFRLISDSQQGKAGARVNGVASVAASVYDASTRAASRDARSIARAVANTRASPAGSAPSTMTFMPPLP